MLETKNSTTLTLPIRPRRLRRSSKLRSMVRETSLQTSDFIYPLFVTHGRDIRLPIRSMPGQYQLSPDQLKFEAAQLKELGIPAVMVFGLPKIKDEFGTEAYAHDGITQIAIQSLKESDPDLVVITDVCLCEYTSHGHCGVIGENEKLLNDPSVELIAATALAQAEAGADIITIHPEATKDLVSSIEKIKSYNKKAGVSLNPETSIDKVLPILNLIDLVLVMSVNPGFGGQKFMKETLEKVKLLRKEIDTKKQKTLIEIDGGINFENSKKAIEAGVDILVSGTTIFKENGGNLKKNIHLLRTG